MMNRKPKRVLTCSVLAVVFLATVGTALTGLLMVMTNRCFFLQFPPDGCPVAALEPLGASLGWHLFFGALGGGSFLFCVLGIAGYIIRSEQTRKEG